ncbi:MAG: ABC transporter permease [Chloroflexota bacterium]|nr:ABC transporter permease [Chloroflexota bacterium]
MSRILYPVSRFPMQITLPTKPKRPYPQIIYRLQQLLRYRELVRNLVTSELKARYKNSMLGFVWSLLNPLGMMLVFTVVFSFLLTDRNRVEKYPLFLLCGLLPWNYFSSAVMGSINSVVSNANLVKKVHFPREVLPIAGVLAQLVNFLLAFVVLFAALVVFRAQFSPWLWLLPLVILIQTCFALGIALILSTLNVFYRDTMMIMDVIMLAWFFLTPVVYAVNMLPNAYTILGYVVDVRRWSYILNPMASLINIYRDLLFLGSRTDLDFFLRTTITSLVVLVFGYWFFIRYSDRFGEEL